MFADEVLRALLELPEPEREVHLRTARTYLRTGSVAETAKSLFCHRNTVANRLHRIRELTEHDLTVPCDAAAVILALEYRGLEVCATWASQVDSGHRFDGSGSGVMYPDIGDTSASIDR